MHALSRKRCPRSVACVLPALLPLPTAPYRFLLLPTAAEHFHFGICLNEYDFQRKEMVTMKNTRWQDWVNLLLGIWLFISPWALAYAAEWPRAAWNAHIFGAAIVIFAAVAVYVPQVWEEWLNIVLGIWMIISPWILGFDSNRNVTANAVAVGVLVTALAVWAMARDQGFKRWWNDHHPAV
jgi:hypothetical protein